VGPRHVLGDQAADSAERLSPAFHGRPVSARRADVAHLNHITRARRQGLPYVYLGYWIEGSKKMDYKGRFLPQQRLAPSGWLRIDALGEVPSEPQD